MTGNFIDRLLFSRKPPSDFGDGFFYLDTDFGKIRAFDTKGNRPVIINVPDGPNVIEHQQSLIKNLAKDFRVVCFEYPGLGFSYPNTHYDYTFETGARLLLQIMDMMKLEKVSLLFSCSNSYYAMQAAIKNPERFKHIFLSQTPSINGMLQWAEKAIPSVLKVPVIGQLANKIYAKRLVNNWYKYSLPKDHPHRQEYVQIAETAIGQGGCFCLSSLVHGLRKEVNTAIELQGTATTLVWGSLDYTHRKTDKSSIKSHIKDCEIVEFENCGHFPELENTKDYVQLIREKIAD